MRRETGDWDRTRDRGEMSTGHEKRERKVFPFLTMLERLETRF